MDEFLNYIDKLESLGSALFFGFLIGGVSALFCLFLTKDKYYVEKKYVIYAILVALIVALMPQFFGNHSEGMRTFGEYGQETTRATIDSLSWQIAGKILGCVAGFGVAWSVKRKYFQ
ncbi:hypothetical protein V2A85_19295 [Yersinia sp. 1252 StPb PI]|uniref:hypothetical protein n=1 Tax=Yersinia sp. 1252 StPb PI TaxID=3117404 RepID=UPI003B28766E